MNRKRTLLFFSLLLHHFFCATQTTGCITFKGETGEIDNRIYTSVLPYSGYCDGHPVVRYNSTVFVPLLPNYYWSPDPRPILNSRKTCVVIGNGSSCGVIGTFSQIPFSVPIDTNIFLLIIATGIIGYFAIYRRRHFA